MNLPLNSKISVVYSQSKKCITFVGLIKRAIKTYKPEEADLIICLGGDGFMLHTLHKYMYLNIPIYGINCGTLGFLMNDFNLQSPLESLFNNISTASVLKAYPLEVKFTDTSGETSTSLAFNEASLLRSEGMAAHLRFSVDDVVKCPKLVSDGILVSTSFGSLAYNKACGGPALPLNSNLLLITAINTFQPNFKGAIIYDSSKVVIDIIDSSIRKVNLFCDFIKYESIKTITIQQSKTKFAQLMFDKNNQLTKKVYESQFMKNLC